MDMLEMNLDQAVAALYDKDVTAAYKNLQALEALSEQSPALYPYFEEFLDMMDSEKYVVRVRGYRLLCRQAKWDEENKIDRAIDRILAMVEDEKPTAVRQKLAALECLVPYKAALHDKIRRRVGEIDFLQYKDTMQGLIQKDVLRLLARMETDTDK